jgi:hypothetical protein
LLPSHYQFQQTFAVSAAATITIRSPAEFDRVTGKFAASDVAQRPRIDTFATQNGAVTVGLATVDSTCANCVAAQLLWR